MKETKIACIIMASGYSTRFGSNKLLAKFNGEALAKWTINRIAQLNIPAVVVTRYQEVAELAQFYKITNILHNEPYQNDTVRLGLEYFKPYQNFDGYMFCTCDQPLLKASTLAALCQVFQQEPHYIHRLAYKDTPGNPVVFPASFVNQLLTLPQDKGGNIIVQQNIKQVKYVYVDNQLELLDIDTINDLKLAEKYKRSV